MTTLQVSVLSAPLQLGKNWMMLNTPRGAQSSAILYSIAETAKANNLKPYEYYWTRLQNIFMTGNMIQMTAHS